MFSSETKWIWGSTSDTREVNRYQAFRRSFVVEGLQGTTKLLITADSRYVLQLNGKRLGQGPVRSWPFDQKYDVYDLTSQLAEGENTVDVLVHYLGVSNFQYIAGRGGLLCEIIHEEAGEVETILSSDETWLTTRHSAYLHNVPRICVQLGFEEQFDARLDLSESTEQWEKATVIGGVGMAPWTSLSERDIPFLTEEAIYPVTVDGPRLVEPIAYSFFIDLRPLYRPHKRDANREILSGALLFNLVSQHETTATWHKFDVYGFGGRVYLNGKELVFPEFQDEVEVKLQAGDNLVVVDLCGEWHDLYYPFGICSDERLEFSFNYLELSREELVPWLCAKSVQAVQALSSYPALETVPADAIYDNIFAQTSRRRVVGEDVEITAIDSLYAANQSEATIYPAACGSDIELLLDFGKEVVGFLEFNVHSEAGVTLDWNCFEGMQEGRWLYSDRLNNTLRYITKDGQQFFHSIVRRGFRYATLTIRDLKQPLRLSHVRLLQNTYPVKRTAMFKSSDYLLNTIWEMSRYTSQLCSEDTYVDCPAYEQAFWVGDARNEGLVDYYVNGDYRLAKRCLKLVAGSLNRSKLPESQVPSGWQDILTAWSLLWLLACDEYYLHTGDAETLKEIYPAIRNTCRTFIGEYLNEDHLLEIEAWNMLDWAPMDTPGSGVVTHQNAWLVKALRRIGHLAEVLQCDTGAEDSALFFSAAERIKAAMNKHLWSEEQRAFVDCRYVTGEVSNTISQQTNTVVYLCDCVEGERKEYLAKYVVDAPSQWVQIGSPFMMFFSLEALVKDGRFEDVLALIRQNWGLMLDRGATTCWEMFPGYHKDRWTRSHCHAWSAAPGYFLPAYFLGVRPLKPGFAEVLVSPEPVDLSWCSGVVPTPQGEIAVDWKLEKQFTISVTLPVAVPCSIRLPAGLDKPHILKGQGRLKQNGDGRWMFTSEEEMEIELVVRV